MLDLTKPLPKTLVKRQKQFLENVLDKVDDSDLTASDLDDLSADELKELMERNFGETIDLNNLEELEEGDSSLSENNLSDLFSQKLEEREEEKKDNIISFESALEKPEEPWYIKKDSLGREEVPKYEEGEIYQKVLISPLYLFYYIYLSLKRRTKDDIEIFLKSGIKVCFISFILSLFLYIVTDIMFLIPLVSIKGILYTSVILLIGFKLGEIQLKYQVNEENIEEESYTENINTNEENTELSEEMEYAEETEDDLDEEEVTFDKNELLKSLGNQDYEDDYNYEDEYIDEEEEYLDYEEEENYVEIPIEEKVIDKNITYNKYTKMLKDIFKESKKYMYNSTATREDLVKSLGGYILCNNPGFAKQKPVKKGSMLYNNTCWLIYNGLRSIFPELKLDGEHKMNVITFTESLIYYKIRVQLPLFVRVDKVSKSIKLIEDKFRMTENDVDVAINVSSVGNDLVFKIMKDSRYIVTWGDAVRYVREDGKSIWEEFIDEEKYHLPIIAGLHNEEEPVIVDLAENTSISISGTSGSGKSWGVYSLMFNLLIQSHPGDVSFVILDFKRDAQYRTLARMPHVVGFHNEIEKYIEYMKEVTAELERRKQILERFSVSKWSELRNKLKEKGKIVEMRKFPWLFVIIEETATVLNVLESMSKNKEVRDEFVGTLIEIAKQGRSLGVRLIMISQRTTDRELPRNVQSECSIKFAFKLDEADLKRIDMMPKDVVPPQRIGVASFNHSHLTSPIVIKALGIGGRNDDQILDFTRMLSFEWHRRVEDKEIYGLFPLFRELDNLRPRREQVLKELKEGKYFAEDVINFDNIEDVLNEINSGGNKNYSEQNKNNTNNVKKVKISTEKPLNKVKEELNENNKDGIELVQDINEYSKEENLRNLIKKRKETDKENENKKIKKEIESISNKTFVKAPDIKVSEKKMSIVDFIRKNGRNNMMEKSEIEKYYSKEEILESIEDLSIVEDGDYFIA